MVETIQIRPNMSISRMPIDWEDKASKCQKTYDAIVLERYGKDPSKPPYSYDMSYDVAQDAAEAIIELLGKKERRFIPLKV